MAGSYTIRLNQGAHDDLYAKAWVMEKDGTRVALVACDLLGISREQVEEARRRIEAATGIPAANIMISGTHAHTGPDIGWKLINLEPATHKLALDYQSQLPGRIAAAVVDAAAGLAPARVSAGVGREDSTAFIRRYWMTDGTVGWNPGKMNPRIVRPAGTIDPGVPVVQLDSMEGKPLAAYVNYANHLDTVGGLDYSADYPFTLSKVLRDAKDSGLLTLFTIGTAGNVNHVNVRTATVQRGHTEAARIGAILAASVLKTPLEPADPGSALAVSREMVPLAPDSIEAGEPERARALAARFGKPDAPPFLDLVRAFKVLDIAERAGKPYEAEVQVVALGRDVAWVGLPGEVFVELGKAIKTASPFRVTIVAELANDSPGYIPDRQAYPQGAYEVVSTRFAPGSGERLVESAVRQLLRLHAANTPRR